MRRLRAFFTESPHTWFMLLLIKNCPETNVKALILALREGSNLKRCIRELKERTLKVTESEAARVVDQVCELYKIEKIELNIKLQQEQQR
jgi:hypothetical protein